MACPPSVKNCPDRQKNAFNTTPQQTVGNANTYEQAKEKLINANQMPINVGGITIKTRRI